MQIIPLPAGTRVTVAGEDKTVPVFWVEMYPGNDLKPHRHFAVDMTGQAWLLGVDHHLVQPAEISTHMTEHYLSSISDRLQTIAIILETRP